MSLDMSDQERLYHSARKSSGKEKTARKKRQAVKKGFMDVTAEAEGVTYTPGGFSSYLECWFLMFFHVPATPCAGYTVCRLHRVTVGGSKETK